MTQALILSLLRILAMVKKEFIAMWMDSGTRKILFLPVIIQSIIFGYGATFNLEHIPYAVCDESQTGDSYRLLSRMEHSGFFELKAAASNLDKLNELVDAQAGIIGVYIPHDFVKDQEILVLADGRNSTSAATAIGYLSELVSSEAKISAAFNPAAAALTYRYVFNEHNITRYGVLSGMILALSFIQVLMLSSMTVARERENGTFDMLLMTPASSFEILIGKAIAPTMAAITQGLILTAICHFYFKILMQGSFCAVLLVIVIFSLCTVGVGLAISAVVKSAQMALVSSFLLMLPSIILSGLLTPLEAMPDKIIALVKVINPLYYGIEALQRIYLEGQSFWETMPLMLPIMGIGLVSLSLASWLFRKALY